MSTKRKSQSQPSTDNVQVRLYLCDEVRQEINNKTTLLGFYPDSVVVVNRSVSAPSVPEAKKSDQPRIVLNRLSFLVSVWGVTGSHRVTIQYPGVRAQSMPDQDIEHDFGNGQRSLTFGMQFAPYAIDTFGERQVIVEVSDRRFVLPYFIRAGDGFSTGAAKRSAPRKQPER
jgi:hypothetical protein